MRDMLDISVVWHHFAGEENFNIKASAVTFENNLGSFDILPTHANLISALFNSMKVYVPGQKEALYSFGNGIVETSNNRVLIFLEPKASQ